MSKRPAPGESQEPADLAIIGCYPPPFGGVATHTRRLCDLLNKEGIRYRVYDATSPILASAPDKGSRVTIISNRRALWLLGYVLTGKEPAVYIMSRRLASWLAGAVMAVLRRKKVVVRIQNAELIDWGKGSWRRRLAGLILRRLHGVVCVNQRLATTVAEMGVDRQRIHWFPGFLPPSQAELAEDQVAPAMWDFANRHDPFLVSNGRVSWYQNQDLYGLDLMVELVARLAPDYPDLGLGILFWDYTPGHQAYLDKLSERARSLGVADRILFHTEMGLFVPILNIAKLFIRATNTDGDASSLREARSIGVPAVASDAAERPEGVTLFANRDLDDLERKTREVLAAPQGDRYNGMDEDIQRADAYLTMMHQLAGTKRNGRK